VWAVDRRSGLLRLGIRSLIQRPRTEEGKVPRLQFIVEIVYRLEKFDYVKFMIIFEVHINAERKYTRPPGEARPQFQPPYECDPVASGMQLLPGRLDRFRMTRTRFDLDNTCLHGIPVRLGAVSYRATNILTG
jgi:hypothetical protein